ncbi:MAG: hypothetical protein ACRD6N_20425 [Pyrinomonadaceae bacterium]
MARIKDQHKVGIREKPRGQQTGYGGNPDQNRQEMKDTPAITSSRKEADHMFEDKSANNVGGDAVTPRTNSPSTPAMRSLKQQGDTGGEKAFKQRLAKKRKAR